MGCFDWTAAKKTMDVVLVSKDAELQKICRDLLGSVLGTGWGLTVSEDFGNQPAKTADLHIWDVEDATDLLENLTSTDWQKHLILLHKHHLPLLQEKQFPAVMVILKPFTFAT